MYTEFKEAKLFSQKLLFRTVLEAKQSSLLFVIVEHFYKCILTGIDASSFIWSKERSNTVN